MLGSYYTGVGPITIANLQLGLFLPTEGSTKIIDLSAAHPGSSVVVEGTLDLEPYNNCVAVAIAEAGRVHIVVWVSPLRSISIGLYEGSCLPVGPEVVSGFQPGADPLRANVHVAAGEYTLRMSSGPDKARYEVRLTPN